MPEISAVTPPSKETQMTVDTETQYAEDSDDAAAKSAAVDWHVKLVSGDMSGADMAAFEDWLRASPLNAEAYAHLADLWDGMEPLADAAVVREGLRPQAEAQATRQGGLVAVLRGALGAAPTAAGITCALVVGVAATQYSAVDESLYRTAVGEREVIELADGSTVTLNTASAVDINYLPNERRITLTAGQANFKVATDARRPFIVHAGEGSVRALGTEFDVYKSSEGVRVTLIEGRVRVASLATLADAPAAAPRERAPSTVELAAGEQVEIAMVGGVVAAEPVDIERVTAWREGRVSFRNTPLAEAVAEMNRYSAAQITLADRALGDLRVSGVFRVSNSDHFVNALESVFGVEARRSADGGVVLDKS